MGRGDRRTKRGKIFRGSYGNRRLKKSKRQKNTTKPVVQVVQEEPIHTEEKSDLI